MAWNGHSAVVGFVYMLEGFALGFAWVVAFPVSFFVFPAIPPWED